MKIILMITLPLFSKNLSEIEGMKKVIEKTEIACPLSLGQARMVLDTEVKVVVRRGKIIHMKFKEGVHPLFQEEIRKTLNGWRFTHEEKGWEMTIHLKKKC